MTPLRHAFVGRVGYATASAAQEALRRRILDGDDGAETLLLLEHDPVITLGRAAVRAHVLASAELLGARGITVVQSTRGGDVTYHGPGQLVAYPVVRLARGVVAHVEALGRAAVEVAAALGVEARFRRDCPGVWVGDRKLASVGLHVHRRVAIHGLALNVATALDAFDLIVPCGLAGTRATSLSVEAGRPVTVDEVWRGFAESFARALGREPLAAPIPSLLSQSAPVE